MGEKSFLSFLLEKFNLIGGIVAFIVLIVTFVTTNEIWLSLLGFIALLCILLILSLFKVYRQLVKNNKDLNLKIEEVNRINKKFDELERKFNNQSKEYDKTLIEVNNHKKVTHVVEVLISAQSPNTAEGKKIINILRSSVENSLKESDKE